MTTNDTNHSPAHTATPAADLSDHDLDKVSGGRKRHAAPVPAPISTPTVMRDPAAASAEWLADFERSQKLLAPQIAAEQDGGPF